MAAVKTALIQMLIKMVSPSSPAYGNSVPFIKSSSDQQLINTLKPGDIIFSRTNSVIYQATRKLLSLEYDHVAVVLSPKEGNSRCIQ